MRGLDPRIHLLGKNRGKDAKVIAKNRWTRGLSRVKPAGDTCERAALNQTNWKTL